MKCGVQIAGTNSREKKALGIFRMALEKSFRFAGECSDGVEYYYGEG